MGDDAADDIDEMDDAGALADAIAGAINTKVVDKQALLTEADPRKRLEMVMAFMEGELSVLQVERKIRGRVKRQMEKTQREYYLNEQMKAIQNELGGEGEDGDEMAALQAKIDKLKLTKEARKKANAELKKLKGMQPMSAEATVIRNYLDVLLGLPWGKKSKLKNDLTKAQDILDGDHYALGKGEGSDRRISCRAGAHQQVERADPVPGRPTGRRQDFAGQVHRQGDGPQIRAPVAGRRA